MCGRYALYGPISRHRANKLDEDLPDWWDTLVDLINERPPRYNFAPTDRSPVVGVNKEGGISMRDLRWGLVPYWVKDVKIGSGGFIYVTGPTASSNFPVATPLDSSLGGAYDVFVTKINPFTGKAVYSTFLGGRNSDSGVAIAVDGSGNVFVTGGAGDQFPTTAGAYRTTWANPSSFVAKLNSTGSALLYSTFIPGTSPAAIALPPSIRTAPIHSSRTSDINPRWPRTNDKKPHCESASIKTPPGKTQIAAFRNAIVEHGPRLGSCALRTALDPYRVRVVCCSAAKPYFRDLKSGVRSRNSLV
jgi:hypothetical protein